MKKAPLPVFVNVNGAFRDKGGEFLAIPGSG
jgi:hypothetical protein